VPVTLDEVELGDHRAREVQAAVIVDGLKVSLLGQSFLQQIDALRIEGDRMILGRD
jgi:aspartyl protease family protein